MTAPQLAPPNNSLALASFILGTIVAGLGLLFGLLGYTLDPLGIGIFTILTGAPAVLAIVFGFIGISTANRLAGKRRRFAVWGVVLGFLPLVLLLVGGFLGAVIFGI